MPFLFSATRLALYTAAGGLSGWGIWHAVRNSNSNHRLGRFLGAGGGGPECVVEIQRATLTVGANGNLDYWSRPDATVECRHGNELRSTPVEHNVYNPHFCYSSKMPYHKSEGFYFAVQDVDKVSGREVIGRCFMEPEQAQTSMKEQTPLVMSLGHGIGTLEVQIKSPKDVMPQAKKQ